MDKKMLNTIDKFFCDREGQFLFLTSDKIFPLEKFFFTKLFLSFLIGKSYVLKSKIIVLGGSDRVVYECNLQHQFSTLQPIGKR